MTPKRPSSQWAEPELITLTSGATVTTILNSGATVSVGAIAAGTNTIGDVRIAGSKSTPTTSAIGLFNSGNATLFVATNTFKILSLNMAFDLAETIKLLSGTDYLSGNASVGMSYAAEGSLNQVGSVDAPVYMASAAAKGFVVNSSATGAIGGHVTWIDE